MVKDSPGLPPLPSGLPDDALHTTANLLHSAALRLLRYAAARDVGMNLDSPRASLLSVLVFAGPQPMNRLAEIERVSPPAITKLVTALEDAGLARRTRPGTDRRVVLVEATPAGRVLLERGRAARVDAVARLLKDVSAKELAIVRAAANVIGTLSANGQQRP